MRERKRRIALFLCLGMIMVLLSSFAYIIHEADHDCTGENCPVCQMIAVNLSVLHLPIFTILALTAIRVLLNLFHLHKIAAQSAFSFPDTLVSWKMRLND